MGCPCKAWGLGMSLRGTPGLTPFGAPKRPRRNRFHGARSSVSWPLALYLTWAAGLAIAYFSAPGRTPLLWASLGLSSVLALVIGIRRYRPEERLPWYLLAAAVTSFAAGDLVDNLLTSVLHQSTPLLSVADVLRLAMYPLCAAALALFIRSRTPWADLSSLLDALIITVGLGLLSWVYLIEPFVHSAQLTWPQKLVSAAYPLGDVLLLALLARLLSAGGLQVVSLRLLTFATSGLLVADVIYGLTRLNGTWSSGGRIDGGWLLFYVLLGATALHPSMVQMTAPLPPERVGIGRTRLLLIAAASLVAPVDGLVQQLRNGHGAALHLGVSAVLFGLVTARMLGVVRAQQQGIARDATFRDVDTALVAAVDEGLVANAVRTALSRLTSGQPQLGVAVALIAGTEISSIGSETRAGLATFELEAVRALRGFDPELVDAATLAVLLPGPVPTGPTALVAPLRSAESLIGALVVVGERRQLTLMQDAISSIGFKVALALQRIALARELHQRASEAHFRALIQNASDVILVVGSDNEITYQTPSAARVLGYHPSELEGRRLEQLLPADDIERSLSMLTRMRRYGVDHVAKSEWQLLCEDGRWIDADVVCSNMLEDPDVHGLVLTIRDATDGRRLERELQHRAFHDSLTSLPNRGLFFDRLKGALARVAREDALVAVLFIDVDDFKAINDTLGHAAGDKVLQRLARILATSIRAGDSAARLGGDEFALLVLGAASLAEVEAVARRVLGSMQEPMEMDGRSLAVRISIGIATSEHSTDAGELLQLADLALYEAKNSFKGTYRIFREELRAELVDLKSDASIRHERLAAD